MPPFLNVTTVALILAGAQLASAAEMQDVTAEQKVVFLAGAAQAITVMNVQSRIDGQAIYCPPADYALNVAEMNRLADSGLEGEHTPQLYVIAAISGLREDFPC